MNLLWSSGLAILLLAATVPVPAGEKDGTKMRKEVIIDFSAESERGEWLVINDGVMGGLSRSEFLDDGGGAGVFRGTVSLENNGGFASVRTVPTDFSLEGFDGVVLKVRGDGKRYSFRLRTDDRFDSVAWKYDFDTRAGEWVTVRLPFSAFQPTWRGRRVPDTPPLDPGRIRQLGFLISDKQDGQFRIDVGHIAGYADEKEVD